MNTIGLIGNPNSGKTTLFNQLTGTHQRVGNWPGVTVECKSGFFNEQDSRIEVVDLPGVYTLTHFSESALDERIARDYIASGQADVLLNVLDGSHLERHLYLTAQLLAMHVPIVIAVNMMDVLEKRGIVLDIDALSKRLGCPVVPLVSHQGEGIDALKKQLLATLENPSIAARPPLTESHEAGEEDPDILIASARYQWAHETAKETLTQVGIPKKGITTHLDRWILNRFLGIPFFLLIIYGMFLFTINVGGIFQEWFDAAGNAVFVQGSADVLHALSAPDWLIAVVSAGIGTGINTTLTFIPVLAAMFFCLSFLEASGYMARAAFVMDRVMRAWGLPGKSLVPLIIGFGCNVPAILGARTLSDPRDRILTIMMSPFMSCSARLAIYAVFVAAFFPVGGHNIVFALYLIGIVMALFTGWLLRKTLLVGKPSPWIMELPSYHWPSWRALAYPTWLRTQQFVIRAGKVIVVVCLLLGILNGLTMDGHFSPGDANQNSLLSALAKAITPIFGPMGITPDNWPATVGLMTGTLAKEVVVATLNTLYSQVGDLVHGVPADVYGEMVRRFVNPAAAFAYLLFVLLYVPCASTMAVIRKELNTRWMVFSILWSTGLAYVTAVVFYQTAMWLSLG